MGTSPKDPRLTVQDYAKGDYVLVMLQRPGDSSLVNLLKKHELMKGLLHIHLKKLNKILTGRLEFVCTL